MPNGWQEGIRIRGVLFFWFFFGGVILRYSAPEVVECYLKVDYDWL